uniref:Tf2-1-like SH3-like domain-containing protein n=1 Tax=Triticum urartu TaxID=4572 RepID=A0A8R7V1T5_TRIUA
MKLTTKYYGPYRILQKIGHVAYKLQLPDHIGIHPVFHVSQLKKHLGTHAIPSKELPLVDSHGRIKTEPLAVLETRSLPRNGVLVTQWLIDWENLKPEEATWEDANFIKQVFPEFFASTLKSWFPEKYT